MATVNSEIRRILKEKDAAIRSGAESMLELLKELHKQIQAELGRAALGSWDSYHLKQSLDSIEYQISNFTAKAKAEAAGLLKDAWAKGQSLVNAPLIEAGSGIYTGFYLSTSVLDTLTSFTFHKIENLSAYAWDTIKSELTLGMLGAKTPAEIAKAIGKDIDAGRFSSIAYRAEVITRTEMGRVFSTAAQMRMEEAAKYVDGLEKEWIHAGHPKKPRETHLLAHEQHVPVDESFNIGGIEMMYPRDPAAPLDEIINCGCDHQPYHARWA